MITRVIGSSRLVLNAGNPAGPNQPVRADRRGIPPAMTASWTTLRRSPEVMPSSRIPGAIAGDSPMKGFPGTRMLKRKKPERFGAVQLTRSSEDSPSDSQSLSWDNFGTLPRDIA